MAIFGNHLAKWHLKSFLWIYAADLVLLAWLAHAGLDKGGGHALRVAKTALAAIGGPMVCAVSRDFQSCCLRFSLEVMKMALPILLAGILPQFVGPRDALWLRILRPVAWVAGWMGWFILGLMSMVHAVS